ncbi:GNAT family N-acetyltransferase [Cellulomonas sp. 179-A 9B4 NHS]|uniref:GNAT family N-acetyltransferase n=1 Tax=Cellulomonas sp. 179-A 9B4 NHS TaxID=3142379 RepID=UPI0039A2F27C
MESPRLRIERHASGDRDAVRTILEDLPQWFGRPDATEAYVTAADTLPNYVAITPAGEQIGVVLIEQHFPETAEIHLMAVKRAWHRQGVGKALLTEVEGDLLSRGTRMLTVKTLGEADPDEGYRRTRLFYGDQGFVRLEELPDLWPGTPCLFMAKLLL